MKTILFIALAIAILIAMWRISTGLRSSHDEEQSKIAEEAIIRAAVQCYALEGRYPSSLEYLETNYGLALNREKYVYHYRAVAENIMPEIRLFLLEE